MPTHIPARFTCDTLFDAFYEVTGGWLLSDVFDAASGDLWRFTFLPIFIMKKKSQKPRNSLRSDLFKNLRSQMKEYTHYVLLNVDLNRFTGGEIRSNAHFFSADFLANQDLSRLGVAHFNDGSKIFVAVHTMSTGWLLGTIIDTYYGPEYAFPKTNAASKPKSNRAYQKSKVNKGAQKYPPQSPQGHGNGPNHYQPQYGPKSSPEKTHAA
jgi:hypothetical protein